MYLMCEVYKVEALASTENITKSNNTVTAHHCNSWTWNFTASFTEQTFKLS